MLWTNYTYSVLDLEVELPDEVQITQDHPNKTLQNRQLDAQSWFETLKLSQAKYLLSQPQQDQR